MGLILFLQGMKTGDGVDEPINGACASDVVLLLHKKNGYYSPLTVLPL